MYLDINKENKMKNKELLKRVGYIVLICLCFFIATRSYFEGNIGWTIFWIVVGARNIYDLVRRIKASNKEDYEKVSDDNHIDDIC